jgi:hypothetical protein
MFCDKCGAIIDENATACHSCGNVLEENNAENPVENFVENPVEQSVPVKKKKSFFKRPVGIVLIVVLVIIIGGGITAYAMRDKILKSFLGPVKYYLYKESSNITAVSTESYSVEGDLALGDEFSSVSSMLGLSTNKINVDIKHNVSEKKDKVNLNFLGLYKVETKLEDSLVSVSVNDGEEVVTDMKSSGSSSSSSNSSSNKKNSKKTTTEEITGLSESSFSDWEYDVVMDCVVPAITEENIDEVTDDYNDMDCEVTTFTVNKDVCENFSNYFADKLETDSKTQTVVKNVIKYLNKQFDLDWEYDVDGICKVLRSDELFSNDSDFEYEYSVYYFGGDIVNRVLNTKVNDEKLDISLGNYTEEDNSYIEFSVGDYVSGELEVSNEADVSDVNLNKKDAVSLEEFVDKIQGNSDPTSNLFDDDEDTEYSIDTYDFTEDD